MLSTANRLSGKKVFDDIKEKGKLVQSTSFAISFVKRNDDNPPRFGFIISTKISPNATVRNRAKRALSEGVRYNLVYLKNGFDCVFLAKPIIIKTYTDELMREVREVFEKAKLTK